MTHPIYCTSSSLYVHSCECFKHDIGVVGGPSLEALINEEIQQQAANAAAARKERNNTQKPASRGGNRPGAATPEKGGDGAADDDEIMTVQPEQAAVAIQSAFRGHKARAEVQQKKEEETNAATTVQTAFRGMHARKEMADKKDAKAQKEALAKNIEQFRPYKLQNALRVVMEVKNPKYWTQFNNLEEFHGIVTNEFPCKKIKQVRYSTSADPDDFAFVVKDLLLQEYNTQLQLDREHVIHKAAIDVRKREAEVLSENFKKLQAELEAMIQEQEEAENAEEEDDDDAREDTQTPQMILQKEVDKAEQALHNKEKEVKQCERNQLTMEHELKILNEKLKRWVQLHSVSVEFAQ